MSKGTSMALTKGIITYDDYKGAETIITWYKDGQPNADEMEYCGAETPLRISWKGGKYDATSPSSCKVSMIIEREEQRLALEDVFNGGYVVVIEKDKEPFWKGQVTPDLMMESYQTYPYVLSINCNDGLEEAKSKHFLMVDWPDYGKDILAIDFIIKIIDLFLYPNGAYDLNVGSLIHIDQYSVNTVLEDIRLDPRVFIEEVSDQYISNEEVLNSFLTPLGLKMVQWNTAWWLVDRDMCWDAGQFRYTKYSVINGTYTNLGVIVDELGIFDLYSCSKDDIQIGRSANLKFLPPWRQVAIAQRFQMNRNIIPTFANRSGNFYHGHIIEGETVFTPLEFIADVTSFRYDNLRNWTPHGLLLNQYPPNYDSNIYDKDNTGSVWVQTIKKPDQSSDNYSEVVIPVDSQIKFSEFSISIKATPTFEGVVDGQPNYTPKVLVALIYDDFSGNGPWYFWDNDGAFLDWTSEVRGFKFGDNGYDIEHTGKMPENDIYDGGEFRFRIYNSFDETNYGPDYGMLINNVRIGLINKNFERVPIDAVDDSIRERIDNRIALALLVLDPSGILSASVAIGSGKTREYNRKKEEERRRKRYIGSETKGYYTSSDINWDNEILGDINPDGKTAISADYIWGLAIEGQTSFHQINLSSPYNEFGNPVSLFNKVNYEGQKRLMYWMLEAYNRDNIKYTCQLSGTYFTKNINPFQVVNDYEGRLYKMISGTWNDKMCQWDVVLEEFKAMQNIPGLPTIGDFSPYSFGDSFFKEIL